MERALVRGTTEVKIRLGETPVQARAKPATVCAGCRKKIFGTVYTTKNPRREYHQTCHPGFKKQT